jgi:hypothetical protein
MNNKRLVSMAVLLLLLVFPASASTVSFLVVETGLGEKTITQYGSLWEAGLMEVFFDAGHIVTNSPIARIEKRPAEDLSGPMERDFNEARVGGADYFILGFLEYKDSSVPNAMIVKIYSTNNEKLIFERSFPAGIGRNLGEEYQIAKSAGQIVVSNIKDM